jgi:hypothetical protein
LVIEQLNHFTDASVWMCPQKQKNFKLEKLLLGVYITIGFGEVSNPTDDFHRQPEKNCLGYTGKFPYHEVKWISIHLVPFGILSI